MRLAVWQKEACITAALLEACVYCRGAAFTPALRICRPVRVCVCVCGANLCGACQNVLAVSSPGSRGMGDVHSRLSVSLLFKSQWDIQKLSAIRTGLCTGKTTCIAQHCMLWSSHPLWMVTTPLIHLLQKLQHGCWTVWFNNDWAWVERWSKLYFWDKHALLVFFILPLQTASNPSFSPATAISLPFNYIRLNNSRCLYIEEPCIG